MHIQATTPYKATPLKNSVSSATTPSQAAPAAQDQFTPDSQSKVSSNFKTWAPVAITAAVGAGLGVYAGLGTGVLPALAGTAAGTGLGVVAAAGFARVGLSEASGAAGVTGFVGGAIAGAAVGYAVSSPYAAIALGAAGGLGFAFYKAMSAFNS